MEINKSNSTYTSEDRRIYMRMYRTTFNYQKF